ncbi:hypothetical protein FKZ69_03985 [Pseudomonas azotoformans]|nr:hypothetical protein FKZ69_03985 [Pseudomonas azotoformans]
MSTAVYESPQEARLVRAFLCLAVYPCLSLPTRTIAAHWHAGHLYLSFLTKRLSIRAKHTSSPLDNVHSMPCP